MTRMYVCLVTSALVILLGCGCRSPESEARARKTAETKKRFDELAKQWQQHLQRPGARYLSIDYDAYNHPAFREMVEMGKSAVPFIMDRLGENDHLLMRWEVLLDQITGLHFIGGSSDDPKEVKERYIEWWKTERKRAP